MPKTWDIELSDGRVVTLESDNQPSEQDILSALETYKPDNAAIAKRMANQARLDYQNPIPGYSPWGSGDEAAGLREMVGEAKTPYQATKNVIGGMTSLGTGALMTPGKMAYGLAADWVAAGQNIAHELETE